MRRLMLALGICVALAAVAVLPALADTGTVATSAGWVWVRSGPGTRYAATGRVYNGATVNIVATVPGQVVSGGNGAWYQIGPGKYVYSGLVRTTASGRWIEVILSQQRLIAHDGDSIFMNTAISSGTARYPTVRGTFSIYVKYRSTPMSGPGYYLPAVPNTMYFYGGYAIHGAYWHNNFGHPMSHGCINMRLADAAALFNWASVGTKVTVR
jgi:lipoprotein-anchoring transpeptidase ErfK/SrfK